jgi:beta-lactamase superfamily II metal-dependent hydrolase
MLYSKEIDMQTQPHFTLWQLPSQIGSIGLSYVIRTDGGKVIVFDGGWVQESGYMRGFLAALGNKVDAWFMSHPHDDHAGVLMDILQDPRDIKIQTIYQSSLDPDWYYIYEPDYKDFSDSYYKAVRESNVQSIEAELGMNITIDGVLFEVLGNKNPELIDNPYNDQSVVVKVSDASKSVLFLGDLGWDGGKKLLASEYASKLKSDYVQMAHHGQNGVEENFYQAVDPKYCLWPTPIWVWDNITEAGPHTGDLTTMQTRNWMSKLNIKEHYLSFNGLVKIE